MRHILHPQVLPQRPGPRNPASLRPVRPTVNGVACAVLTAVLCICAALEDTAPHAVPVVARLESCVLSGNFDSARVCFVAPC